MLSWPGSACSFCSRSRPCRLRPCRRGPPPGGAAARHRRRCWRRRCWSRRCARRTETGPRPRRWQERAWAGCSAAAARRRAQRVRRRAPPVSDRSPSGRCSLLRRAHRRTLQAGRSRGQGVSCPWQVRWSRRPIVRRRRASTVGARRRRLIAPCRPPLAHWPQGSPAVSAITPCRRLVDPLGVCASAPSALIWRGDPRRTTAMQTR